MERSQVEVKIMKSLSYSNVSDNKKLECVYFNKNLCKTGDCKPHVIECNSDAHNSASSRPQFCFALWANISKSLTDEIKGCWISEVNHCSYDDRCVEQKLNPNQGLYFCCCSQSHCNQNVYYEPVDLDASCKLLPFGTASQEVYVFEHDILLFVS